MPMTTDDVVHALAKCVERLEAPLVIGGTLTADKEPYTVFCPINENRNHYLGGIGNSVDDAIRSCFSTFLKSGVMVAEDFIPSGKRLPVFRLSSVVTDFTIPCLRRFKSTKYLRIPLPENSEGVTFDGSFSCEFAVTFRGSPLIAQSVINTVQRGMGVDNL